MAWNIEQGHFGEKSKLDSKRNDFIEFINSKLKSGHYTPLFLEQLLTIEFGKKLILGRTDFWEISIFTIMDIISYLEGESDNCSTKKETQFKGKLLYPYYHKHIECTRTVDFIINNSIKNKAKCEKQIDKAITYCIENKIEYGRFPRVLSHYIIDENLENAYKNKKVTGEWIIFEKRKEGNLYLTFASHDESDENIFQRIAQSS